MWFMRNRECCGFISFPWTMLLLWEKMWEICLFYIRFGWNFLACVTKAASVHTLEGCSVLWIMGVSFEEPSLPCIGTLGALACEKGGNKVVKFAQSTPPPPPYPFIPALFSLLNMKSRTGGMPNTSHTLQMTLVPALVTNNTYINTNQSRLLIATGP